MAELTVQEQEAEWLKCSKSAAYFIDTYVQIYDKVLQRWIPFRLWGAQYRVLRALCTHSLNVVLKARQTGLSWLGIGYHGLWKPLFRPIAKTAIFSKRDDEAVYLLGEERLKGMYERLPVFLQAKAIIKSDAHIFALSNGSVIRAFPTSAGDSYAMTDVILDEFDLVPDQNQLMRSVKPTIDGGGSMTMISRTDKSRPNTEFKRVYRGARAGTNGWHAIFLPWYAHPNRDPAWYQAQETEILDRTGSTDELYEQYPETDEQALAPRTLDKRIPPAWLQKCYDPRKPLQVDGAPAIPGLEVYRPPESGHKYVVGVDPAEGNPTSDDSAISVVDRLTGEEVCVLAGKFEPSVTAYYADRLGRWYNNAPILVERNNHGHAVLLWLKDNSPLKVLVGDDHKPGWLDNSRGKAILYDNCADRFHDKEALVHSEATYLQLASIEGATLRAPQGDHDDRADAYALGLLAAKRTSGTKKEARSYQG